MHAIALQYPDECRVHRMAFRGGKLALTEKRWAELTAVNAPRSIARSGPSATFSAWPARNG
jgi:hypothetical protein